jgi:hypothetical protein
MDWVFLAVGGFLLGVFFYSGLYTTHDEPEVKYGYATVGAGILLSVATSVWVDFHYDISDVYRGVVLLSYTIISLGLTLIVYERRKHRKEGGK